MANSIDTEPADKGSEHFAELGYPPLEATPVDIFPATSHVETVCLLAKGI